MDRFKARFERIEAARPAGTKGGTDSEGGHYSVADARQYFQKLHAQSMANRGYNSHMDHHLGLFLGGSPHAPQAIASFVEGLVKDGRAYLGQGRNHFESVRPSSPFYPHLPIVVPLLCPRRSAWSPDLIFMLMVAA